LIISRVYVNWYEPATDWLAFWVIISLVLGATLICRTIARRRFWTRPLQPAIIIWFLITAQCLHVAPRLVTADPGKRESREAPPASLTLADGRIVNLTDLKGRVVLLDFWATWCPPCRASFPAVDQLGSDFSAAGLVVVGISADQDADAWHRYLSGHQSVNLHALDKTNELATRFGGFAKPTFILVDRRGRIRWRLTGWRPLSYQVLRREIAALPKETGEARRGI